MKKFLFKILLHVIFPLVIGFFIYWFYRPDVWFIHLLNDRIPILKVYEMNRFQKLLIFSGTDFCWSYSFTSILIFWKLFQKIKIKYFSIKVLVLILISELVQLFADKHFTFDWFDLIAALVAFLLSSYLNKKDA